ncbi:cytochrome c oxidase accessory protein CcoG [Vreelandella sp. EE27]
MQPIPAQDITPRAEKPPTTKAPQSQHGRLYVRESKGFFQALRRGLNTLLMLGFFLLPWLEVQGRPAIWLDIPGREFHLFSTTFYPQEFILLALLFIAAAFGLFFITALAGRVWCGYTCPQSVWTFAFMWVEHRLEGSRHRRIRRDRTRPKGHLARKAVKHALWAAMALVTAVTVVGYFTPVQALVAELATLQTQGWALFWVGFFGFFTYLNAGWLREQVCLHMCPYARFQSVMFDRDTLTVAYDARRGEPRGRKASNAPGTGGDCIDCSLCVQVCPTGIDIREGLQYACIQCAACVDACDTVMDRLEKPRGLIRYTTQNRLEGRPSSRYRLRYLGYLAALTVALAALAFALGQRVPVSFEAERPRASLYTTTAGGDIQNVYRLTVRNRDRQAHTYRLSVEGVADAQLDTQSLRVPAGASRTQVVNVSAPGAGLTPSQPLAFILEAEHAPIRAERQTRFLSGERR